MPASGRFSDHFSRDSTSYARHRPHYPARLFDFLAGVVDRHRLAWDCATGSGQAAVVLGERFDRVVATDASATQIDAAIPHPRVSYRVAAAEESGLDDGSVDLVTVGQALHWFDTERFFAEARRVLVANGVLAVWCYELCRVTPPCDEIVERLYSQIVGEYWPRERRLIEEGYAGIGLPGRALETPRLQMELAWTAEDMLGYLRTWSACNRYRDARGSDPVSIIETGLRAAWGDGERPVSWPLTLLVTRL